MILSLESAEILLIEQNLITRDELEELKRIRSFGKKNCKALRRFKKAVKEDYRQFFPQKPCSRSFARTADRLFRNGGYKDFPASEDQSTPKSSARRLKDPTIDYREEEDNQSQEDHLSQASEFYVKSSQEEKTEGKGSNNPRHPLDTRHEALARTATGAPVTHIAKSMEETFNTFGIFNDESDSRKRTPMSLRTLYRAREQLPLVLQEQQKDFVAKSSRLTLSTDGVSTFFK